MDERRVRGMVAERHLQPYGHSTFGHVGSSGSTFEKTILSVGVGELAIATAPATPNMTPTKTDKNLFPNIAASES
jgi:hypothetical protein